MSQKIYITPVANATAISIEVRPHTIGESVGPFGMPSLTAYKITWPDGVVDTHAGTWTGNTGPNPLITIESMASGFDFLYLSRIISLTGGYVNNNITHLNVDECVDLTLLGCQVNSISSLNLSNCTKLETLNCSYNSLTSLNVDELAPLITLNCEVNKISSLNLATHYSMSFLICNNNNLNYLNIGGSKIYEIVQCHDNNLTSENVNDIFNTLQFAYAGFMPLSTELDISNNSQYGPDGKRARAKLLDNGWIVVDDGPLPPADPTIVKISELNPDQVHLRDYERIYTGTNQEGGYENPFLGFTTDTASITFKADKSTYFHYPKTADQISLSATDLIEAGAFAGAIPYKADKIFKKNAGYENDTPWGKALPENTQNGVWLCAWLSGNDSVPAQTPIWMDRWYNPGSLNSTHSLFVCSTSAVYDEPSHLTFDPGVWYRYDHIGDNTNLQITNMVCALDLHIDEWAEVSLDSSENGNDATLYNFTASMISSGVNPVEKPLDDGLKLNGINQYGSVLFDSSFNTTDKLTCNVWVKSDDWQNQPSHHFISNGLRGGWSLGVNNGFFTPFNALITQNGSVVFNNQTGNFYKDIGLPGTPSPVSFAVDSELYTWVLDNGIYNGFKHLYKIDFNGNIENAVYFPTNINLYDIAIDENDLVWVSNDQARASAFDAFCNQSTTSINNNKKLVINSSNSLTAFDAIDACVFEDTYYWTINSLGDLYCNNGLVFSGLSASNVQCSKDYTWALFDNDKVLRIDKEVSQLTNAVTFSIGTSATIPDISTLSISGRNIFFTNETNEDYVWILQPNTEYLYKYDTSLNLIQKTNIVYVENSIQSPAVKGDASGYQWHRLFNFSNLQVSATPQIEAIAYTGTGTKYKTTIPVSILSQSDWHMFTFSIDAVGGSMNLYMDTVLRTSTTLPVSSSIFYKYETPLLIGSNVGHINPLDVELNKINKIYHSGSFDDLRIYTDILNNSDIRHIYLTKFSFKDLVWGLPVGTQSYIEEIVRFFKFKMPGQKSQYYNIHLKGLQITDESVRQIIEDIIRDAIQKIAPLYTSLYKIVWD